MRGQLDNNWEMEDNWKNCGEGRGRDDSGVISSFSGR